MARLVAGTRGAIGAGMRAILILGLCVGGCMTSAYDPGAGGDGTGSAGNGASAGGTSGGGTGAGGAPNGTPTFYRDVMPVFQKDCLSCHASGGSAQPVLDQAASATAAAGAILAAIQSKM